MSAETPTEQVSKNPFVHLHVHTEFSLLDGLSKIDKLVTRAKSLGMGSLAITDHGTMFGAMAFYRACQKEKIKPIIGVESYLARYDMRTHDSSEKQPFHLLLLAKNQTGYKNLLRIASAAQLEGFYSKPRIDRDFLAAHAEGLICTSGCLAAQIPRMINEGRENEALRTIGWYQDVFGKDSFFLELQNHDIPELLTLNRWLIEKQHYARTPLLATNDVHYIMQSDFDAHDTLLCIQTGALKSEVKRMRMTDPSYHLRSQDEMWNLFNEVPDALYNTQLVSDMCDVNLDSKGYHLPVFPVPEGYTAETYLRHLAERGLHWRYGDQAESPEIRTRLDYELSVIHKMGFDTYFLIVWDLTQFARHADIWWNVRGSGAGSVAAYTLGITSIDPMANNLIFERFLNPGRVSMPDIDIDFPDDRRMAMIDYAMRKYGSDKVAAIITFGTLKARAAIKDVARALNYPLATVTELTKLVPQIPSHPVTLADCLGDDPDKAVPALRELYDSDQTIQTLLDTALTVEGVARNAGTHAAGVIIGDKPLVEYLPLHRATGDDTNLQQVTQFPMEICESIGLLKVDFLGLSTLTIMRKACDLIEKYHGIRFNMSNIPYRPDPNNPETTRMVDEAFDLMGKGETTGVFQLESAGMKRMLIDMKPRTFEHVIAAISLYRPGPMALIPTFIRRMHGEEEVTYHHPLLESILQETYSIVVYQEQIQQIAAKLFGYSLGDADMMRRAVSKKKAKDLQAHKEIFMQRGPENGVPPEIAEKIFDEIEYFAAYGFNKCVSYNTEIIDAMTGRMIRVGDLATGKVKLTQTLTCDTDTLRLKVGDVSAAIDNGIKPVYRLVTRLGHEIEATANHPFYTFDGWRMLGELSIGERLAVPRRITVEGTKEWADHEVIVLGHLLAEGNLCHPHGVYYYTSDDEQWQDYVTNLEKFDNTLASTHQRRNNMHDVYSRKADSARPNGVVVWIDELGLRNTNSYTKFIPDEIFELTNRQIALLIARMWEGDGNITEKDRFVYYATSSVRMAHQLQHLFLRLGIISRVRRVEFKYRDGRVGYQVHVHGNNNLKMFLEIIASHFVSQNRREKLTRMIIENPASSGTKDSIPVGVKHIVRREKAARDITWEEVGQRANVAVREFNGPAHGEKSGYTHSVIGRLAEFFDCDELRVYANNDIYWDEVVSIEYIGEQPTYDLTIPGTHNFVANDIIVHNSHAADYAVLTCQTAYLKAHFPAEYYTALLSVQRDVMADVALFTSDCRRFGIPVLPPSVNSSELDFTIETLPDGKRGIRYGLGAVKNAGEKAVQQIVEERLANGPFSDLTDFCQRVDQRTVGKRAMESLIKVGVFDVLGDRDELFLGLERLVKFSQDYHKAKDTGQLSLFGGTTSTNDMLSLTTIPPDGRTSQRDRLRWEKELIGLYVSEHPLNEVAGAIGRLPNIHYSEMLKREAETLSGRAVTFAGLIVAVRQITTKKSETMAILTVEDVQGLMECVMFPRTWNQYRAMILEDAVIIVWGKADASRGDMQIIVDKVSQEFDVTSAEGDDDFGRIDYGYAVPESPAPTSQKVESFKPIYPAQSSQNQPVLPQEPEFANFDPWVDEFEDEIPPQPPALMITIRIGRTADVEHSKRRIKRIYGLLTERPGLDHFRFLVYVDQSWVPIDFDNGVHYDEDLATLITGILGPDSISVEVWTPQPDSQRMP